MKMTDHILDKLTLLPDFPGVYIMKDARGEIIYIGKAVSLKNRVRQYFQSSKNHPPKVIAMVANIIDFAYILTDSENEALTLESNLIKKHKPRYNILLKDDKHFPYVRIDWNKPFPKLEIVRKVENDGAKYYGPFLSAMALRDGLEAVRASLPLRTCNKDLTKRQTRPCLHHQLGHCTAPCAGKVTKEEYEAVLMQAVAFLSGRNQDVIDNLRTEMAQAAAALEFEKAARLRDQIAMVEAFAENQKAILANTDERDVFALARDGVDTLVYALFVRGGKLMGGESYELFAPDENEGDVMASFLKQFYSEDVKIPREVILNVLPSDFEAVDAWLSERAEHRVHMYTPQKGDKKKLVDLAKKNAGETLEKRAAQKRREWERNEGALAALSEVLGLDEVPRRIEAYDNSNIQGMDAVSSMVVFTNGKPAPKEYRRFKVKTVVGANDYETMNEVITRRFTRGIEERAAGVEGAGKFSEFPDLVLIDGGKGQLRYALAAMEKLGVDIPTVSLAERLEELHKPDGTSILLPRESPALHLVQRVRDEAHRFAITYHKSLHKKTALFSLLDEIEGVGPKRKKALFTHFVSINAIKEAPLEALEAAPGMNKRAAKAVYEYFHKEEGDKP